jgi:hypothetical protein
VATLEADLVPLIGKDAASLTVRLWRVYAAWWFETTFVTLPLVVAVQLHHSAALAIAAAVAGTIWAGLAIYMAVTNRRVAYTVRAHVQQAYGFRPRFTSFRDARAAYGWLRLDQLYQAAGMHFSRTGTTKAYGTRWSRPRLIQEMEATFRAEGRSLPPGPPVPRGWS